MRIAKELIKDSESNVWFATELSDLSSTWRLDECFGIEIDLTIIDGALMKCTLFFIETHGKTWG